MRSTNGNRPSWLPHLIWTKRQCPGCDSMSFKPAEHHPEDDFLTLFGLRPVRCKFCWRRYYWFALSSAIPE